MTDDMHAKLQALQSSVDGIATETHDIRREQERTVESHKKLHAEQTKLAGRMSVQERTLELHLNDYQRLQERNEMIHQAQHEASTRLESELKNFRSDFAAHARGEEQDRKDTISGLRQVVLWIAGTGVMIVLAVIGFGVKML